ncbi:hypothetical protein [Salinibacillus xinjiangensis]|uniref:Uncharacterized protein n=1 Tax=Salinibacillus xinjiangensis TaxID=1229268 RepID=A0A6G1XAP3_9BACI|nr:hypothetical protein [Salinibacillus xinjiangensis]MRG88081.1 hypothetical protein [Salinibacillus xinjiangensis]
MRWNMLVGTLLGFTISFLIISFWRDEFEWMNLLFVLLGGVIANVVFALLIPKDTEKKWKK